MFLILPTPLERLDLRQDLANPAAGALVSFEGWVRDWNNGREVRFLEYECYEKLALKEGTMICQEAIERFDILEVRCFHRIGRIAVGEMAVWAGATAAHRSAAFQACQYVIDEVKHRVPIWKKETYADGGSEWVNCAGCAAHSHAVGGAH